MNTRRASVDLIYNGTAATVAMTPYITSITYTDPASEEADSLDIAISDRDGRWIGDWMPIAGDTMTASICLAHWDFEGDTRNFDCGYFLLDDFSFSGHPIKGTISGLSTPVDSAFAATKRSATWEQVTIQEVAKEKADTAGITLQWEAQDCDFVITSLEQSEQTDSAFLLELCETYGLCMKVYLQKIVIYDREVYKAKDATKTYDATDLLSWSWKQSASEAYTGGTFAYTDPTTEQDITVTIGEGERMLAMSGDADSQADAERKLIAGIHNANHGTVSMSISVMGSADVSSTQCVNITGLSSLSGKYYIDSITHNIGGGYTMDLSLSLVES